MYGLTENQFIEKIDRFKQIEKVEIRKTDHMDGHFTNSGMKPFSDKVLSQYYGLINCGIHLPAIVGKFNKLETLKHPISGISYNPQTIKDNLVRYCELNRTTPIHGYKDPTTNVLYGIVSPEHVPIHDKDVFNITEAFVQDIPHDTRYYHDDSRMMIDYEFKELGIELPDNNRMNFCLIIKNSPFGMGILSVEGGAFEHRCGNGVTSWVKDVNFKWSAIHRWRNASYMLEQIGKGMKAVMSMANISMEALRQANEIIEPIIKENENVVTILRSKKFNLLKREAESIYRRIISNPQYRRMNGFDVGRAIAEEARDTGSLDRRIELEQIAGHVMTSQVKH